MMERAAGFVLTRCELFVCTLVMCKEHRGVLSATGRQRALFEACFPMNDVSSMLYVGLLELGCL